MPKVKESYFEGKRNLILDAAYAVLMRKPLYEVKMKDIIAETGLSQGGIYRYFASLDEIIFALLNREEKVDIKDRVDEVLASSPPELVISDMFALMAQVLSERILGCGKIYFELAAVFANSPERFEDYCGKVNMTGDIEYLQAKTCSYIEQKVREGYFQPKAPLEDIFHLLAASFDGIERDIIFAECYNFGLVAPILNDMNAEKLLGTLCVSLLLLLNGKSSITVK